jgi:hypothetical protein
MMKIKSLSWYSWKKEKKWHEKLTSFSIYDNQRRNFHRQPLVEVSRQAPNRLFLRRITMMQGTNTHTASKVEVISTIGLSMTSSGTSW